RPPRETARLLLYGVLAVSLFLSLASEFFWERMQSLVTATDETAEMDHSASSRIAIIHSQWEIFKAYPLGAGHQGTTALSYQYIPAEYHASEGGRASHNTVMTVLVDQGIPGIVLWFALLVALYRMCRNNHRVLRRAGDRHASWINSAIAAALGAIIVGGMFSQQLRLEIFYWFMSLLMALSHWVVRTYPDTQRRPVYASAS
ncbi:MAG: O-antigen ligase family protein, partial [Gammaproteobacteria bacterium]